MGLSIVFFLAYLSFEFKLILNVSLFHVLLMGKMNCQTQNDAREFESCKVHPEVCCDFCCLILLFHSKPHKPNEMTARYDV